MLGLYRLVPAERVLWARGLRQVRRLPPTLRARVPARVALWEHCQRWDAFRTFLWWLDHPVLFVRVKASLLRGP